MLFGFFITCKKLTSQIITFEHEGNWSKALEYYDLQVRSEPVAGMDGSSRNLSPEHSQLTVHPSFSKSEDVIRQREPYKGLIRSLQKIGCTHVLDLYCQGLTSRNGQFQHDLEFTELQVCLINYICLPNVGRLIEKSFFSTLWLFKDSISTIWFLLVALINRICFFFFFFFFSPSFLCFF